MLRLGGACGVAARRRRRLTRESQAVSGSTALHVDSVFDKADRRTRLGFPNGRRLDAVFDSLNRITQLTAPDTGRAIFTQRYVGSSMRLFERTALKDAVGSPEVATSSFAYDGAARLTQLKHTKASVTTVGFEYGWDAADNKTFEKPLHDLTAGQAFTHDGLHRLTGARRGTLASGAVADADLKSKQDWALDRIGNWESTTVKPENRDNSSQTRTHNASHQVTSITVPTHASDYGTPDWWVDAVNGSDTTGDGSESNPYKTLSKAWTVCSDGEVIKVKAGGTITKLEEEDSYSGKNDVVVWFEGGATAATLATGDGGVHLFLGDGIILDGAKVTGTVSMSGNAGTLRNLTGSGAIFLAGGGLVEHTAAAAVYITPSLGNTVLARRSSANLFEAVGAGDTELSNLTSLFGGGGRINLSPSSATARTRLTGCLAEQVFVGTSAAPLANFTLDYNCVFGGDTWLFKRDTTTYTTLADWQSASGKDAHSISVNPDLDGSGKPYSTSPLIDRGSPIGLLSWEASGAEPLGSGGRYDIGRYEYSTLNNSTLSLLYDAAGNLTRDGDRRYFYDCANKLTRIESGPTGKLLFEARYDALGRRVEVNAVDYTWNGSSDAQQDNKTRFYYDGFRVIEDRDSSGNVLTHSIWGDYLDECLLFDKSPTSSGTSSARYYALRNDQYSVHGLVNESGTLVERYRFSAYGTPEIVGTLPQANSAIGFPWLYTGQRFDFTTGLHHYKARPYSSHLGRFLSRDPLGYVDGMGLYEYVRGRPGVLIDPWGYEGEEPSWARAAFDFWYESTVPSVSAGRLGFLNYTGPVIIYNIANAPVAAPVRGYERFVDERLKGSNVIKAFATAGAANVEDQANAILPVQNAIAAATGSERRLVRRCEERDFSRKERVGQTVEAGTKTLFLLLPFVGKKLGGTPAKAAIERPTKASPQLEPTGRTPETPTPAPIPRSPPSGPGPFLEDVGGGFQAEIVETPHGRGIARKSLDRILGKPTTLQQVKEMLGRVGMSIKEIFLEEVPDLGPNIHGLTETKVMNKIKVTPPGCKEPLEVSRNELKLKNGKPHVKISKNVGLSSLENAIYTIGHELKHVKDWFARALSSSEKAADSAGAAYLKEFKRRWEAKFGRGQETPQVRPQPSVKQPLQVPEQGRSGGN